MFGFTRVERNSSTTCPDQWNTKVTDEIKLRSATDMTLSHRLQLPHHRQRHSRKCSPPSSIDLAVLPPCGQFHSGCTGSNRQSQYCVSSMVPGRPSRNHTCTVHTTFATWMDCLMPKLITMELVSLEARKIRDLQDFMVSNYQLHKLFDVVNAYMRQHHIKL